MVDLVGDRGLPRLSPPHLYLTLSIAPMKHLSRPTYEKQLHLSL